MNYGDIFDYMSTIKYNYNFSVFTNEDEISYYLLGAFITDGCIYKSSKNSYACQLSSCDQDWLNSIKNRIGSNLKLHKFKENYYGIRIIRDNISQWFISHGCHPRKTYNVTLPLIPNQYFADFMRGCIDGDGSIGIYTDKKNVVKRSCQLISASKVFLEKIQNILQEKNINSTIINRGKHDGQINGKIIKANVNSYSLNFGGKNCYQFLKYIYYNNHVLSLQRKNKLAQEIIKFYETSEVIDKRHISHFDLGCKILWPTDEDLLKMINESNIEKLSKKLGVHGVAIRRRLQRRNIYNQVIKYQKVCLPSKEILLDMIKNKTYTEIAKELNTTIKTLRKKMKQLGLP